jgi:hypothetical protein
VSDLKPKSCEVVFNGGCNYTTYATFDSEEVERYLIEHGKDGFLGFVDESGAAHSIPLDVIRRGLALLPTGVLPNC